MQPTELERMTVAEVMERWPATVAVFNGRGMACPGCAMAAFMTVAESAASYEVSADDLVVALLARISADSDQPAPLAGT